MSSRAQQKKNGSSATATDAAAPRNGPLPDVEVRSSRSVVAVQPGSRETFELPRDGEVLEQEQLKANEELLLGLNADLVIRGPNSARLANTTHGFFVDMLDTLEQTARASAQQGKTASGLSVEEEYKRNLARTFHSNISSAILNQSPDLVKNSNFMRDLSNVEGLLQYGVEPYIAEMRKFLKLGVRDQVDVALHKYGYAALDPAVLAQDGVKRETVGGMTLKLLCAPAFCLAAVARRFGNKNARVTANEEPLLSRQRSNLPEGYFPVLKDVTCLVKSRRLTLVLGPPGSGKTSLLKAMSGQLLREPGKSITTGELTYNGRPVNSLKHLPNWVAYASQNDDHMPLLTVRETLEHAFRCRKEVRFDDEALKQKIKAKYGQKELDKLMTFKKLDVDVILAVLGLTRCADTIIGNDTLKGVSGGERRRVTLGEMLAVGSQILCLDEISTGLDSAATFDICQYLRHVAHIMDQCVVVSLLQPPPEVIDLFDDVLIIAEGSIIYHGEREKMMPYFESLGFQCPPRKDLGDFLQEIPTRNGAAFRMSPQELAARGITRPPPATPAEFAARWKESEIFKAEDAQVRLSISQYNVSPSSHKDDIDIDDLPENPWYRQLYFALSWSWRYRLRDIVKIKAKQVQNLFIGILFGTLFFQVKKEEAYQKSILYMQVLMFTGQTAMPEVQTNAMVRSIYHKHIDQGFYKAWMFALAQTITCLPLVMLDNAIYGNLIYWMAGLAPQFNHYILFCAVAILYGATMQCIMGIFPYMIAEPNKAQAAGGFVFVLTILMSGVIATADVIPYYLKPIFYVNPFAWAFKVLSNIEFLSPAYDDNPCDVNLNGRHMKVPQRCGDFFLASRQIVAGWDHVYEGVAVLFAYLIGCWLMTALALTYVRFAPPRGKKKKGDDVHEELIEDVELQVSQEELQRQQPLKRQDTLLAEPVTLVIHDLGYSIQSPSSKSERVDLLSNISCYALPGRMLALMGSSGAGKTTLLDVLAGIKTVGKARGNIFLNGKPLRQSEFNRLAGYVQQFGVHSPTSTIRESLEFSLALRLPKEVLGSNEERHAFVEKTLELLELDLIQDQLAGQCSMEQNKRLTLGVELVANPSIVFADEPTSSLDARAAANVMRVLHKVAQSGRVVIATIHQPSVSIFQSFDDLLLLKKGGQVVYFGELGPNSRTLIEYFEAIPGVPPCPAGANPAAWMLDVIGGGTGIRKMRSGNQNSRAIEDSSATASSRSSEDEEYEDEERQVGINGIDFASVYRTSRLKRLNDERMRKDFGIAPEYWENPSSYSSSALVKSRDKIKYKRSTLVQLHLLLQRNFVELWRMPEFSFSRIISGVFFSSLFVAMFFQQELHNTADVQSRILCVTFCTTLVSTMSMTAIIPFTISRRALFYRETGSGMYRSAVFTIAAGIAEIPYMVVTSVLVSNIVYWGVGFNPNTFPYLYFMLMSFIYLLMMVYIGMLMASVFPEVLSASLASGMMFSVFNTFAGIFVPHSRIPHWYLWIHYFSPLRWFYEGLLSTQFHGDGTIICNPIGSPVAKDGLMKKLGLCTIDGTPNFSKVSGVVVPVEEFVLNDFLDGFKYDNRWIDFGILITWIIVVRVFAALATTYISHDKR